jgi:hypothetical protein
MEEPALPLIEDRGLHPDVLGLVKRRFLVVHKRILVMVVLGVIAGLALAAAPRAQEPPLDPRIAAYDKGPAKIDVSKYPKEMQVRYKVFSVKCSKCHTLARPINSDYVLDDEWDRYVKRMMHNAVTFIGPDEGKQIYEFLVYDSKIRKKALYDKKLKESIK